MLLGRVIGSVVATAKDENLRGQKLLIVRLLDGTGAPLPRTLIALDAVGAGAGEMVYCCRGKEASFPWLPSAVPSDATIVGIADAASRLSCGLPPPKPTQAAP